MGSDFRRGLDTRDSRLDLGFTKSDVITYYVEHKLGQKETAKKLGIDYRYLLKLLKEYDIEIKHSKNTHIYIEENMKKFNDDSWLIEQYDGNGRSLSDIAKELSMSQRTIKDRIKSLGICIRKQSPSKLSKEIRNKLNDKEYLKKLNYEDGMTLHEIANLLEVNVKTVNFIFKEFEIPVRVFRHQNKNTLKKLINFEWMYEQYAIKKLSPTEISLILECTDETVKSYLRKLNIELRNYDEAKSLYLKKSRKSKFEIETEKVLKKMDIEYIPQFSRGFGPADFYLVKYNAILECDGTYWHSLEKATKRDKLKTERFENLGYVVYRIPEKTVRTFKKQPFYSEEKIINEIKTIMEGEHGVGF